MYQHAYKMYKYIGIESQKGNQDPMAQFKTMMGMETKADDDDE
jgi:hypothetical protein